MSSIKCDGIIFDMDGTIWDNTPLFAQAWTRAAQDCGYDIRFTNKDLQGLFGKTMKEIADAAIPDENPQKRYDCVHVCEEYEMADLRASREDTTYPGLVDTIKELSTKMKVFIVSNCQSGYIEIFIDKYNVGSFITDFICYGDNGLSKGDNVRLIADKYELKNPLYIGDIQGDKNACDLAGVGFIWAAYGYGDSVDDYVAKVEDIRELPALFA